MLLCFPLLVFISHLLLVDVSAECTKFVTHGSTSAYYDFYRFYDFRNLRNNGGFSADSPDQPLKVSTTAPWNSGWKQRFWYRPASGSAQVNMLYTTSQISINDTYLTLQTARLDNGTQLAAGLEYTEHNITHTSMRMSARVRGASGAVAGFFTYHDDTNESDIEILTRDRSNRVRYTNQPTEDSQTGNPVSGSTVIKTMPSGRDASQWNVYRLDWIQDRSAWYFNGAQAVESKINVPKAASKIILNMWSNGGSFSGVMEKGGQAWFDIEWVELLFNATGTSSSGNGTLCSSENGPGSPIPVAQSNTLKSQASISTLRWVGFMASFVSVITGAVQ